MSGLRVTSDLRVIPGLTAVLATGTEGEVHTGLLPQLPHGIVGRAARSRPDRGRQSVLCP
jgi:hypothetical protein